MTRLQKGRPRGAARIAARRGRLLALIRRNAALGMLAPTFREYMAREGLRSLQTASDDFDELEAEGHIRRLPARARAIESTRPASVRYFQIERRDDEAVLVPLRSGSEYTQGDTE